MCDVLKLDISLVHHNTVAEVSEFCKKLVPVLEAMKAAK